MAKTMTAAQFLAALKAEGVPVRERKGWRTHNRNHKGAWGPMNGVMVHHTASDSDGIESFVSNGNSALPGPLCHGLIEKTGRVVLIGWGRANHAGGGDPDVLAAVRAERWPVPKTNEHDGSAGSVDGNAHFVGYECVNQGNGKDPWPAIQLEGIARACAAVCRFQGWTVDSVIRHLDWSDWKVDPRGIDWTKMRARISTILAGKPNATPFTSWADGDGDDAEQPQQPEQPSKPDADAYPGAAAFGPGRSGPHVTRLGQMLVKRGGGRFYSVGPGPRWGEADRKATEAFQRAQGWTGSDADGIPGGTTWRMLVTGTGKSIPAAAPAKKPVVSLANVIAASRKDPAAPQGKTSHPADVKPVEAALLKLGFLGKTYAADGAYGTTTVAAYNAFRRSIGLKGADAVGDPGRQSLGTLGSRSGLFTVK
ncbi:endolysin [Streptomyces phage YDN12]|uniref:Endolysin n=1 Tax=Streptomyces phage YDN12 TaxID=1636183 RepID=A0A0E3JQE4_9CAUD|nr:endolysin [Streptomyces phage YDN12]AKA61696.1 endolysin [Streptomyces phage YDN12]